MCLIAVTECLEAGRGRLAVMSFKRWLQATLGLANRNEAIARFLDGKGLNSRQLNRREVLSVTQDFEAALRRDSSLLDNDAAKTEWDAKFQQALDLANENIKRDDERGAGEMRFQV